MCRVALTLSLFQTYGDRRRSSALADSNGFFGNANLPDLVQQSPSPLVSPGNGSGRSHSEVGSLDPYTPTACDLAPYTLTC